MISDPIKFSDSIGKHPRAILTPRGMSLPQCVFPFGEQQDDSTLTYIIISGLLILGMVGSYVPQFYRMIHRSSSLGFSPWFLLLGLLGSSCTFFNGIVLYSHLLHNCTRYNTYSICLLNGLGVAQLSVGFFMFLCLFSLYFIYYPAAAKYNEQDRTRLKPEWESSLLVLFLAIGSIFMFTFISILLLSLLPTVIPTLQPGLHPWLILWGSILGYFSALCSGIQYIPQIHKTWIIRSAGSLSIPMMGIQSPGTLFFIYVLTRRPGVHYTTWLPFVIGAILQGVVLALCIYFEYFTHQPLVPIPLEESVNLLPERE